VRNYHATFWNSYNPCDAQKKYNQEGPVVLQHPFSLSC